MKNAIDRLIEFQQSIKDKIGGQNKFESYIGISSGYISNMKKKNGAISSDVMFKLRSKFPFLNIEWLVLGEGTMLKSESQPLISYHSGRPYYNVDFIGGFDLVLNDQTINPDYNIDFAPYNKKGVIWCNITGHSMEPEISSGDIIAIREVEEWDKFMSMNETYAIVTKNNLRTVKKIRKGSDDSHLTLVPVNKECDAQEIAIEMILKVYSVLGCMKRL
ncbi:MAG: S24 family peptidase [Bacteroidaceae bacterium]